MRLARKIVSGRLPTMNQLISEESLMWRVTPDLLGVLDISGVYIKTNPAWQETLGWSAEEIASHHFLWFLHPDDVLSARASFDVINNGQPDLNRVNRYRHKDGSYRWLSWNAAPDEDAFFCSARDITEAKNNEDSIRDKNFEAELREQFIAILGHDLRNPLSAVSAALRLIPKSKDETQRSELIEAAQGSVSRMAHLINQLMDFARARLGGDVGLEFENVGNLKSRLHHVVNEIRMGQPNARIEVNYDSESPVFCDPNRMCQLLSNLVSNAVSHGNGNLPITIQMTEEQEFLTLTVANSADQIPDDVRGSIFEPFSRSAYGHTQKGLGLGLFICKQIAEGHGGSLTCDSDEEVTSFKLRMPMVRMPIGRPAVPDHGDILTPEAL